MQTKLNPIAALVCLAALTGCASTATVAPKAISSATAKQDLSEAITAQMRSSFGYETDIFVSNAIREQALAAHADHSDQNQAQHCETQHDTAYISLTKALMAEQKVAMQDIEKTQAFDQIRETYLACVNERYELQEAGIESFDIEAFLSSTKNMTPSDQFDLLYDELQEKELGDSAIRAANEAVYNAERNQEDTTLEQKKAKLLNAYLIEPSALSIKGNYQPLLGKFTALPAISYDAKNIALHLNQPLYIDLKQGIVYLWADNFAMLNSETLDKQLGTKWRDKWLAIRLNDGSLPPDFAKDLIGYVWHAKKQSFDSLDVSAFEMVNDDTVLMTPNLLDNLSSKAVDTIKGTGRIIRLNPNAQDQAYARYLFADTLYRSIVDNYSEFAEPSFGNVERTIEDGLSVIEVVNVNNAQDHEELPTEVKIDSRLFVRMLLNTLVKISYGYQSDAQYRDQMTEVEPSPYQPLSHYGLTGNKIGWIHQRQYLPNPFVNKENSSLRLEQPMLIDVFTTITPVQNDEFARLPAHMRTPNAQNSVNVMDYSRDLVERIKSGDDKYSQMLIALLTGEGAVGEGIYDEPPSIDDDVSPSQEGDTSFE